MTETCKNGHPRTPENTKITTKGGGRRGPSCKVCAADRERERRAADRAVRDQNRAAAGQHPIRRGLSSSGKQVRWRRHGWFDPYGRAYVTVEAIEYERANDDSFRLSAKRGLVKFLEAEGIALPSAPPGAAWWEASDERELDWATGLPMTLTIRTIAPVIEVSIAA